METGLPWKSSSLSGSAVTAPMVRREGRLRFGVPVGSDAAGSVPGAGGGWRLRRALQAEVGSVFVPGSIESSWLRHTQPRARRAGAPASDGTEGAGLGRGILGWGTPSAMWVVMGVVPVCPSMVGLECPSLHGWEERHQASLPAAARGSQAGGTVCPRSPVLLSCAGTAPPGLPGALCVPVVMAAGGSVLPVGLGWWKRGHRVRAEPSASPWLVSPP